MWKKTNTELLRLLFVCFVVTVKFVWNSSENLCDECSVMKCVREMLFNKDLMPAFVKGTLIPAVAFSSISMKPAVKQK